MGRNMNWDRYTPKHEPWYEAPLMPRLPTASRPPRKRMGMVKHPKGTPLKMAPAPSVKPVTHCLKCGSWINQKFKECSNRSCVATAGRRKR